MNTKPTATMGLGGAPEAHLWARNGKNVGRRYSVGKPEQVIGRSASADIEVDDDRVSAQHARIVVLEGRHHILDLGSTNGTFVNDQRVDEAELRDGDLLQIGETIFEYLSYEERNLTITLRGGSADSVVPPSLRSGAQQMLERERHSSSSSGSAIPLPGPGGPRPSMSNGSNGAGAVGPDPHAQMKALVPLHPMAQMPQIYPPPYFPPPYPAAEPAEPEISLKDLIERGQKVLEFFSPYWRSIAACVIIGIGIGVWRHATNPPPVKAVFQMALDAKPTEANPGSRVYRERQGLEFFRSAEQTFRSPPVIQQTLMQLGVKDVSSAVLSSYQRRLVFDRIPPNPNLIYMQMPTSTPYEGSFTANNPEDAVRFLETHVRTYLDTEIEKTLKQIRAEADFLAKQVQDAAKEVDRAEFALLEFQNKNIEADPEQARQYQQSLFDLERQRSELARTRAGAAVAAKLNRDAQKKTDRMIVTREQIRNPYKTQIEDKRRALAEARADAKGEDHPDVVRLREELKRLEELSAAAESKADNESERTRNPLVEHQGVQELEGRVTAASAASRIALIDKEIERLRKVVVRLPALDYERQQLVRSHDAAKRTLTQLQGKLKGAKLQVELEKNAATSRYDIISPVMIEEASTSKDLFKQIGTSGAGLFVLGLAQAAVRQFRKKRAKPTNTKDLVQPEAAAPPDAPSIG